ncbi:hypothetical protein E2C01_017978 [Portunus trituberculatus]|uniref:Uncharacterized protein n=1 Tax=Portunus trituberculatus TaxID=210409 RepID=A0A5B7DVG4_PORTR|nr:hypothetical protein [Portunus trituberculatus]
MVEDPKMESRERRLSRHLEICKRSAGWRAARTGREVSKARQVSPQYRRQQDVETGTVKGNTRPLPRQNIDSPMTKVLPG